MEFKTIIEVQAFGDFDMKYTECIMVSPEKFHINSLYKEFYDLMGIKSNKNLDVRKLRDITEDFISFLELKRFKRLHTDKMYFCD